MNKHVKWVARTVLVTKDFPDPEAAYRALARRLSVEGHIADWNRNRYHEKRCIKRRRLAFEKCKSIYNEEMKRKIQFVMKSKHENPWRVDFE